MASLMHGLPRARLPLCVASLARCCPRVRPPSRAVALARRLPRAPFPSRPVSLVRRLPHAPPHAWSSSRVVCFTHDYPPVRFPRVVRSRVASHAHCSPSYAVSLHAVLHALSRSGSSQYAITCVYPGLASLGHLRSSRIYWCMFWLALSGCLSRPDLPDTRLLVYSSPIRLRCQRPARCCIQGPACCRREDVSRLSSGAYILYVITYLYIYMDK